MKAGFSFSCAALLMLVCAQAYAARIAVVKSDRLGSYNSVVTAFTVTSAEKVVEYDLAKSVSRGKKVMAMLKAEPPDLVLAIGPLAASLAKEHLKKTPVLFCMVHNPRLRNLTGDNITGISLSLPLMTQLKTLKIMAQDVRRVGVLYNEASSGAIIVEARKVAKRLGLTLVAEQVDSTAQVGRGLGNLRGKVDALWIVPDKMVFNTSAHASMVDFALRDKIPFFSLTPKLVKAGALVSLSPDYASIGHQAAKIAQKIINDHVSPSLIPITPPEGLEIALNLETAKKIGVECDIALKVFTFAATKGFPIKVYR